MNVLVLDFLDTALVNHDLQEAGVALLDFAKKAEEVEAGKCVQLRWTTQTKRSQKGKRLLLLKFWVTPLGTRKIRLQQHVIRENGSFGPRIFLLERHNGKLIER